MMKWNKCFWSTKHTFRSCYHSISIFKATTGLKNVLQFKWRKLWPLFLSMRTLWNGNAFHINDRLTADSIQNWCFLLLFFLQNDTMTFCGRHFINLLEGTICILKQISLRFVLKDLIYSMSALVQAVTWCQNIYCLHQCRYTVNYLD